jgi:peptidoglycan/LPS O-acetylase OafA/YrhL
MKITGWFGLIVGVLMGIAWTVLLATGQVPELETQPLAIKFHLLAEFATALLLVVTGIGLLKRPERWQRRYLLAAGMLLYSLINAAGYFLQQGQQPVAVVFAVFLACTFASIQPILRVEKGN